MHPFGGVQSAEAELEAALRSRQAEMDGTGVDGSSEFRDTDDVLAAMNRFLGRSSDYEGVEPPNVRPDAPASAREPRFHSSSDEWDSDDDPIGDDDEPDSTRVPTRTHTSCKVVIDPDRFLQILSGQYGSGAQPVPVAEGVPRERPGPSAPVFRVPAVEGADSELSDMMDSSGEEDSDGEQPSIRDVMVRT